jgi:hypothetical protein
MSRHIFYRDRILPIFDIPQYLSLEFITQGVAIERIAHSRSESHINFVWIFIFTGRQREAKTNKMLSSANY